MNTSQHLCTSFYAPEPHDYYRDWVNSFEWNIGLTIQPCNPRYTAGDMESLGSEVISELSAMLRISSGLWMCFVREQSRAEGLWHLHGLMRLDSNKRIKWMRRQGEDRIRRCCDQFADRRGSRHSDPSIDIFNQDSTGGDRWISYINKETFKDPNGDRWIFGRPH